ncbi:MAG: filamentous hemagglutinin N-terminal domain-containing protein, partial [Candidatus Methylacidiphilales bacterium]
MYIFAARFGASWYRQLIAAWLITFLGLNSGGGAGVLWANPSGGSVQSGSATINTPAPGQVTVNQTSNRAVVNWGSFSIQQGETTTFVQPSSKSAVLNRVTGGSASQINGNLNANGQVYLVNKNGVVIGKSGRVNTAGFTASTHDVSNAEFMQGGDLNFSGTSGAKVQNFGKIKATDGDVTLIAREVENHGRITARKGTVSLAGGTEVLVKPSGADGQRVYIKSNSGSGSVVNSSTGSIRATAAELRAAGGNEYALAVNNEGVIRATAVDRSGGRIVLKSERGTVQNSGKLLASSKAPGKDGGSVVVTGENVKLTSTSRINVSSKMAKGGTVNIGGGFQGKDTTIANAKTVTMEAGAEIVADGPVKGGTAILWSDERTDFLGSISARGAGREVAGSGGFAEVSSKGYLNYNGTVDTAGGTLLLDPGSLTIVQYGVGLDWQGSGGNAGDPFAPNSAGADSLLNIATLRIALDNNDVWLQAGSRININTAIAPALGSYSLTLTTTDAGGSIVVNAPVTLRPDGNLIFNTTSLYLNAPLTVLGTGTISGSASLATVNVGAGGRIQNGVNAVATGGTVNVGAGTIVENISISKSVTVAGVPDTGITWSTVVDGNAAGPVFYIDAPSATVVLKNLAITNGNQPSFVVGGGGVSIANAQRVELTSVNVYGNTALSGGGIFVRNLPELLISGSVIANNTSTSALSGPSGLSSYGGGIAVNVGNSAINALVENSTISGNRSSLGAGGIHIVGGGSATLTVRNSTISSNVAAGGQGGGIRVFRFGLVVENSTIAQNTASAAGGGISNDPSGNVTIHSSIVALNTSSGGDIDGAVNSSSSYNLIGNPFGSSGFTIVTENILLNPASITWLADIGLAPLAYYGGRTQTHALLSTSLARNTGTALALTTDQRGQLRTAGLQTDIGSYEAQAAGTPSSYIVTNTRDYDATNSADAPIGGTLRLGLQGDLAEKPNLITFNIPVPGAASPDFPNYNTATGVWTIVGKT